MSNEEGEITALLAQWQSGQAHDKLFGLVFGQLRRIAANQFKGEREGHTLQPTAVVNEAWLKLVAQKVSFQDRAHFFAIAAQAMRRILVDHARQKRAQKREAPAWLEEPSSGGPNVDVIALDVSLEKLSALDQTQARVVELKYFAGLTNEEAAEAMGTSVATVKRAWQAARAFLFRELA